MTRAWVLFGFVLIGCAGVSGEPTDCATGAARDPRCVELKELPTPKLISVPNKTTLGDMLLVVGEGFVSKQMGTMRLHFVGSFSATTGETNPHEGDITVKVQNPGRAELEFGPNNIFVPSGDRVGLFSGTVQAINREERTGLEKSSEPMEIAMEVMPSIAIEQLHSVDAACSGISREVTTSTNLSMGFRALGIGSATENDPIVFRVQFLSPDVTAQFVQNIPYPEWPFPSAPTYMGQSPMGQRVTLESKIMNGASMFLNPRTAQQVVRVNPMVIIGQSEQETVKLYRLFPGALPQQGEGGREIQLEVVAMKENANPPVVVRRPVRIKIFNEGEIDPRTITEKVIEEYEPKIVCPCAVSNLYTGTDFTFSETSSETRSRTMSFNANTNTQYGGSINFGSWGNKYFNLVQGGFNSSWAITLGTDASETISSETSVSKSYSQHVPPGYSAVCYRQTVKKERRGQVIFRDPCGNSALAGELVVTDWNWNVEIAIGPSCAPPPVKLKAQKFDPQ